MNPMPEHEVAGVTRILEHLGAAPEQSETMARQLLKRAYQMAEARQVPPAQILQELLQKIAAARQGYSTTA